MNEMKEFDPENLIVKDGRVHALSCREIADPQAIENNPCRLCSLKETCSPETCPICDVHNASDMQYYTEIGVTHCEPPYSTIDIIPLDNWEPC